MLVFHNELIIYKYYIVLAKSSMKEGKTRAKSWRCLNWKGAFWWSLFYSHSFCVNGKHFVLVHGGLHGAWCWYKVVNQLKSAGHNVTTLDLAAAGINPKQVQGVNSFSEYNEPLITFLASLLPEEKVILVGHSLGGVSVSICHGKITWKNHCCSFRHCNRCLSKPHLPRLSSRGTILTSLIYNQLSKAPFGWLLVFSFEIL